MRSSRVLALLTGLTLLGGAGCGEEPAPEAEVVRPIKILEIGGAGDTGHREYPGTISASQSAELAFEVQGKLSAFPVEEGQGVEAGTVLARLDPRDYEARLDKAQANVNNARTEYERARKLFEEGVMAEAEKDRRQRAFEVTEAELREMEKALEDTVLRAPFAGVVARKLVQDFENVQAKQPVLLLEDAGGLEIKIDVPERDVVLGGGEGQANDEITRRLQPKVIVTSLPDRAFDARVKEFSTAADPATRTFQATLAFETPSDVRVLSGMTAKALIRLPSRDGSGDGAGLSVPARAVLANEAGESFVWVVDPEGMTVSRRAVAVGALSGDRVAVTSGLGAGDWLAVSGVHHLREGMQVSRAGD